MSKVTVITSVFKGQEFLSSFLADVKKQTIFPDLSLLLIDCSPDERDKEQCERFCAKHPETATYIDGKPDKGVYNAWNIGVKASQTPYLTNWNLDDRLNPTCLEKHIKFLDERPEIDLVYCKNLCTHYPNETWESNSADGEYPTGKFSARAMIRHNLPHNHPVWRKSLHDRFGLFDSNLKSAGDYEMWLRCVKGGAKFDIIPEYLGLYYWNPTGISTNKANKGWKQQEEIYVRNKYKELHRA